MSYSSASASASIEPILISTTQVTSTVASPFTLFDETIDTSDLGVGEGYRIYYKLDIIGSNPNQILAYVAGSTIMDVTSGNNEQATEIVIEFYRYNASQCFYRAWADPENTTSEIKAVGAQNATIYFTSGIQVKLDCVATISPGQIVLEGVRIEKMTK